MSPLKNIIAATTRMGPLTSAASSIKNSACQLLNIGFEKLVLHADFTTAHWEALHRYLPPRSIAGTYLFAPLKQSRSRGVLPAPGLGSLNSDERRESIKRARQTVEFCDRNDIPFLIIPPISLENPTHKDTKKWLQKPSATGLEQLKERRSTAPTTIKQLDCYLSTLSQILDIADRYERRVTLVPGGFPHEQPDLHEIELCLEEFSGAPLGILADLVRVHRYLHFQGPEMTRWKDVISGNLSGILVHDGTVSQQGLPLGKGEVDLENWRPSSMKTEAREDPMKERFWIVDIAGQNSEDALLESLEKTQNIFSTKNSKEDNPLLDSSFRDPL